MMQRKYEDLRKQKFGRLTVLDEPPIRKGKNNRIYWHCVCECGKEKWVTTGNLKYNNITSCGCLRRELLSKRASKTNKYNLTGKYGIGYFYNREGEFYFNLEDYNLIKDKCWYMDKFGYARTKMIMEDGRRVETLMHRLIMQNELIDGDLVIDHINGKTYDNRRDNLRVCTQSENNMNQKLNKRNTSGYKGVYFDKNTGKWTAEIQYNKNHIHLGRFATKEEAIESRRNAELKYFGEYSSIVSRNQNENK